MNPQTSPLPPHHQHLLDRFTAACRADTRVVAAFLGGSYALGTADLYSDLDLYLITTDEAFDDFLAGRDAFIRSLASPLAQRHAIKYPAGLDRLMSDRLEKLGLTGSSQG